jgi:hypothetical protein
MATESIGALVPTAIPGYVDAADIQAALRAYHYGSYDYNPANTSTASLINPSIAYTITNLQSQITAIGTPLYPSIFTEKGGLISASASSTPVQLAVGGSNGMVLTVNSATTSGLEWQVPAVTLTNSVTLTNKTLTSPTITTPVIDSISASAATGINPSLYPNTTTGNISIGAGLTTGQMNIATVGTGVTPISIGHTNATIGLTGNTTVTGTLTSTAAFQATTGIFTGATLAINGATPQITSSSTSVASIFTSNVNSILIGSSTIKTTDFPADGTTATAASGSGFKGMPQVTTGTSRSFAATDAGKHVYVTSTGTTQTIPANGTVAFPIGTSIVIVNGSSVSTTIAITTDTLRLANTASTGSRTLASNGMCTLLKINSTEWIASGNGLT